jgi:hypothetical protein
MRLLELLLTHPQQAAEFNEKPAPMAKNWLFKTYGECIRAVSVGGRAGRRGAERVRGEGRFSGERADRLGGEHPLATASHEDG